MIHEIRTYTLKPRSLPEVLKRIAAVMPKRQELSPLGGFWYTEVGMLNQVVHAWPYEDLGERERIRAEAGKDPNWPPKNQEFLETMEAEIFTALPFVPAFPAGKVGPLFELRSYIFPSGKAIQDCAARWEKHVARRMELSPCIFAGYTDLGRVNKFVHIWAYESFEQRMQIRDKARAEGIWPPPGPGDPPLTQESKLMWAAEFSPIQ